MGWELSLRVSTADLFFPEAPILQLSPRPASKKSHENSSSAQSKAVVIAQPYNRPGKRHERYPC